MEENDIEECEDIGFVGLYSGSTPGNIGYCGIQLGEFDECCEYIRIDGTCLTVVSSRGTKKINFGPSAKQLADAKELYDALPPQLRKVCLPFGVYIVASTS